MKEDTHKRFISIGFDFVLNQDMTHESYDIDNHVKNNQYRLYIMQEQKMISHMISHTPSPLSKPKKMKKRGIKRTNINSNNK
jgi:hypothetical protein